MADLTFIPYELPNNISQKFSADKFRPIDDFTKPCDKPASQPTDWSVSQQGGEPASKVRDRSSPAKFIDPYRNLSEDLVKWLRQKPVSDCTGSNKQEGDSSSKAQDRGDSQGKRDPQSQRTNLTVPGNPLVIEDNCNGGSSRFDLEGRESCSCKNNEDTPNSKVNPIDPVNLINLVNPTSTVGPIDNRVLQPFSRASDLENISRAVANNEGGSESLRDARIHLNC